MFANCIIHLFLYSLDFLFFTFLPYNRPNQIEKVMNVTEILTKRINIFTGHFGSGKTELAINFANEIRKITDKVAVDDLDIINPYFRTRDVASFFKEKDIELLAPPERLLNADLPVVSPEIYRVMSDENYTLIVDAGGDKDGATALGQYYNDWKDLEPELLFVLNACRPYVSTLEGALYTISQIEQASRLKVTGIINNTNVGKATSISDVESGLNLALQVSKKTNIPFICSTLSENLKDEVSEILIANEVFYIKRHMKLDWE